VRISDTAPRVIVEDVRSRERVLVAHLDKVGEAIARLLENDVRDGPPPTSPAAPPA
jgi:hypothetical protein